ncbi:zinc ribbon domain-containing protein [Haloplanus rubicundus]|uniref:Transposase n=1 Tax=Haloplanus rubicundus TaxID=1547898 RepID=A0A345EBT9_9EURY|nr:transposase [Haloplanus rubicundus]
MSIASGRPTIVVEVRRHDCDVIVVENLEWIRARILNAKRFQQWAFNGLQEHVVCKGKESEILVGDVPPQHISQRCSHSECEFTREDHGDGNEFEWMKCKKELHVDYNAVRNIGWFLVEYRPTSGVGRTNCQVVLKSGTVNGGAQISQSNWDHLDSPILLLSARVRAKQDFNCQLAE